MPDDQDPKLIKAAALRARGYQEINPVARSCYLSGALELEGAIDLDQVLAQTLKVLGTPSAAEQISGWRYHLDADNAGDTRLVVGITLSDTGEHFTVRLPCRSGATAIASTCGVPRRSSAPRPGKACRSSCISTIR